MIISRSVTLRMKISQTKFLEEIKILISLSINVLSKIGLLMR